METVQEKAYAKLNISLDVGARRADGYHDMTMVMQSVSLCDDVSVTLDESGKLRSRCNLSFIPGDERNLAVRAAKRYLNEIGREELGVLIEIQKNIPVGAGMAGGSTDAAATLRAMDRLFDNRLGLARLEELARDVGSDVAFCVSGGTSLATGRGELLSPLPAIPDCVFVICKPEFSISTPELFKKLDQVHLRRHPDTPGILQALEQGDLRQLCRRLYNVFEDVDDRRMRTVSQIKSLLLDYGALGAVMTGTGSAVFGIFDAAASPEEACKKLRQEYGFCEIALPAGRIV